MKRLLLFIVGALLFGAAALGLGYLVWQDDALIQGGVAFALAFVPAAATLAWVIHSYGAAPDMRLIASLGGSGVRMMVALGGAILLTNAFAETFTTAFFGWLALFYLVFLFFEMALLVQQDGSVTESPRASLPNQSGENR